MIEIIPAILAHDEADFRTKLEKLRPLGLALHIDVMDGVFTTQRSWAPSEAVAELLDGMVYDAHLMVANPEQAVPRWIASGARNVIFHVESTNNEAQICRAAAGHGANLSLALNPDTPVSRVTSVLPEFACITVMGVTPGKSGQAFQEIALEKICTLRALKPSLRIIVDGGARPENIRAMAEAGANAVVAGSAITDQDDVAAALQKFKLALEAAI